MANIEQLAAFDGDKDAYLKLLEDSISNGDITQEVADAMLVAFSRKNKAEIEPVEEAVVKPAGNPELAGMLEQQKQALKEKLLLGTEVPDTATLLNRNKYDRDINIKAEHADVLQPLAASGDQAVIQELANRDRLAKQTFLESLQNPDLPERLIGAASKAPAQLTTIPTALAAIGTTGIEKVTGADLNSQSFIDSLISQQREIDRGAGTGPAITPVESLAENVTGLLVPGGAVAKTVGIGGDFVIDQTVRELTDDQGEQYNTIFDRGGFTNNQEQPYLSPLTAGGAVVAAGIFAPAAVNNLTKVKLPKQVAPSRLVSTLDINAPKGLTTVEKASDLTLTNIVDEQQALKNIIQRQGVPNFEDIELKIDLDTHAAGRVRVQEGINTGKLTTATAKFDSPIAPKHLYDAYNSLDKNTRTAVGSYINLKDMRDDIVIAIANGKATNDDLLKVDTQLQSIVKSVPQAEEFSKRYNIVTTSLRNFAEGSLFTSKYKTQLDATRPNYVPLEISQVDPNAPLLQRLSQAQTKGNVEDQEWFLQSRESVGDYDVTRRPDPFDMLIKGTEATLTTRMKNDTKLSIIDALSNGEVNQSLMKSEQFTIKRATAEEATNNPDRLVRVYRDGNKETYITSKLTANLLQFDPYIAKWSPLYMTKRAFEHTAVGPLSVTFAPVTAIRDMIGGAVTRPDGLKMANPAQVLAAIPRQLWGESLKGISNHFQKSFLQDKNALPEWMMTPANQQNFADKVGTAYLRSMYHQIQEQGGDGASIMKDRIEIGKGAFSELKKSLSNFGDNDIIPGTKFAKNRMMNMVNGFLNLYNAMQEAPRFATTVKNVNRGMDIKDAVRMSKRITGDTSKSGRVYDATGNQFGVDAVDQGALNFANKYIGKTTEVIRESAPFFNPMIQGNRQLIQSFVTDPVGTNLRAWAYVGIPSLVAFGWNENLGKEYNDYAMDRRSARDVAMTTYVGIPGRPPEEGVEIPLPHELVTFGAPFTRGLYDYSRGANSQEMQDAFGIVAESILSNSLDVSYPVVGQAAINLTGHNAPDSIFNQSDGMYKIKEDNIGVLPENVEYLARTLFSGVGDLAINGANAMAGDMSFETLYGEMKNNILAKTPIAKNTLALKKSNTHFSIPNQLAERKFDSATKFREYYDAFFESDRFNADDLQKPSSSKTYTQFGDADNPLQEKDLPFLMIGPERLQRPINPLYEELGPLIKETIFRGEDGMTALTNRAQIYSKYTARLKDFNKGDSTALQEWQAIMNGISSDTAATIALQDLLKGIDLSKYDDRIKLINEIESRRADIINSQLDVFETLEDELTAKYREEGLLGKDDRFDLNKHLNPFVLNPFKD